MERSIKFQQPEERVHYIDSNEYQFENNYQKIDLVQLMQPYVPNARQQIQKTPQSEEFYLQNKVCHEIDTHFPPSNIISDRHPPISMQNSSEMFS